LSVKCEYAPCEYVEEVKEKVGRLEIESTSIRIDMAVVKRDIKMLLAITGFVAITVGGYILKAILDVM
jgi:hypothetical protein